MFKRQLISKVVHRPVTDLGRAGIADHILDAALYGLTAFFLLDWLDVELGLGIKSMLTFGSDICAFEWRVWHDGQTRH